MTSEPEMTSSSSSIAGVTSDGVVSRLEEAVITECTRLSSERLARVRVVNELITGLGRRGLLKKQEFGSATSADFEKRYCAAPKR